MLALLKAARRAYKAWKTLDAEQRASVAKEAQRVRALAAELGGSAAARYVDGTSQTLSDGAADPAPARRPRTEVTAELREAVEALARGCGPAGAHVFNESAPRSVQLAARALRAGARRVQSGIESNARALAAPQASGPVAAWYPDPLDRFDHRYWDGSRWTEHVARDGVPELDPAVGGTADETTPNEERVSMSPLFGRKPKLTTCFMCSEQVDKGELRSHYETHVFEVTDENGERAYSFECPRCGVMDRAWGAGRPDDSARFKAAAAVAVHLMQSHSVPIDG